MVCRTASRSPLEFSSRSTWVTIYGPFGVGRIARTLSESVIGRKQYQSGRPAECASPRREGDGGRTTLGGMALKGKVVQVTGAARGMGRAYVRGFLEHGARVVATDRAW